jgi:UDP-N-acetylmuramoylalanine--D-glutamate ligase
MEWRGKRVIVVGLGRSGRAAARLLLREGAVVVGTDLKPREELAPEVEVLEKSGVSLALGGNPIEVAEDADCLIVSPGVPEGSYLLMEARRRAIPVIGEIEFAYLFLEHHPIIAVTGTNGKTTTTAMIGEIFKKGGQGVWVGGNMAPGEPLSEIALKARSEDIIVAEVSTFQLESIERFRPKVGVLTNITPDHLDRHPDFASYARLKARLFENQTEEDWAVLNADDPNVVSATSGIRSRKIWFSRNQVPPDGVGLDDGTIFSNLGDEKGILLRAGELKLRGMHNVENAMAAAAAALTFGISGDVIRKALSRFQGVPHRLEEVARIQGVLYVNNSMCTNPAAGARSLEAFEEPVVLIAGGKEKGLDMTPFYEIIQQKAKAVILIGDNANKMKKDLAQRGFDATAMAVTMGEAVKLASSRASAGDVVLLSPGCASFGQFTDFMDRGEQFKAAVKRLGEGSA